MTLERFQRVVTSADELAQLIGSPSELVIKKELAELDDHMKSFIAQSPFLLLGTHDQDGRCDVSPRGDVPAAAKIIDSRTLLIADRPGNRRADSLRNILETGGVGLLFLIPGLGETLRVNGRGSVIRDDPLLDCLAVDERPPRLGIAVEVQQCYFQCAKALIRAGLWQGSTQRREVALPSFAQILVDQTKVEGETVQALQQQIDESYAKRLY